MAKRGRAAHVEGAISRSVVLSAEDEAYIQNVIAAEGLSRSQVIRRALQQLQKSETHTSALFLSSLTSKSVSV